MHNDIMNIYDAVLSRTEGCSIVACIDISPRSTSLMLTSHIFVGIDYKPGIQYFGT